MSWLSESVSPSPSHRPLSPGLALVLTLALVIPPLIIEVQRPAPIRIMETLSFLSSQETWLRLHAGEPSAWKMPSLNGQPRIQKPPLLVWLNLLTWQGLTPNSASVENLTARARWLAVALSVLCVGAVFWLGAVLGGVECAVLSALMTGLSLGFIRQARYASYDTHLLAWTTLAVAGAVWACCAKRFPSWRYFFGWLSAALALTATNYTKGPLGFALVTPPWIAAVAMLSPKRAKDAWALAIAVLFNVVAISAWFVAARRAVPNAGLILRDEYTYIFELSKNPLFYFIAIPLVFPWSLWLAAGALIPGWRRLVSARREMWFAWLWFASVFLLLSLSPVKNKRYLAPLFPAAGVLGASAWLAAAHAEIRSRAGRFFQNLSAIHWSLLTAAAIVLPVYAAAEPWAVRVGLVRRAAFGTDTWPLWAVAPLLLLPLAGAGVWAHRRRHHVVAAVCTAAWFSVAATFGFYAYARHPFQQYAFREDAERLAQCAKLGPVYYISRFQSPYHEAMPGHDLLIYFRGVIPPTSLEDVKHRAKQNKLFFVMTRLDTTEEQILAKAGLHYIGDIRESRRPAWKLWANHIPDDFEKSDPE